MQSAFTPNAPSSRSPTVGGLIVLIGFVLLGGVISTLILFGAIMLIKGIGPVETQSYLTQLAAKPTTIPNGWYGLMGLQAVNHLGTFLVPALLYWYLIERQTWAQFSARPLVAVVGLSLVVLIVIVFMPGNGLVIEWNQNLHLPQTLAPLEQWIRDKEKSLEGITKYITTFDTPLQLAIALLVIAVIPGIGEEVLFRGVLQRNLIIWTRNVHVGVWLAAALFSAIHVQFLGFVPRMLLGALFGYLYIWSGNIWVPILAHFVNNGFTVLMVYLYQRRMTSINIESTQSSPMLGAFASLAVTAGLLWYFKRSNQNQDFHKS